MLPIYLCDDDPSYRAFLQTTIESFLLMNDAPLEIAGVFEQPHELIRAIDTRMDRGIYFLDVDLKDETYNGFTLAKEIRKRDSRGFIVFITSHHELAYETFRYRVEALDYIDKANLQTLPTQIENCFLSVRDLMREEQNDYRNYYEVLIGQKTYLFPYDEILFIETSSQKHRLIIHTQKTELEYFAKLKDVASILGSDFFQTHRSFLVNREHIREIDYSKREISLSDGSLVSLSRTAAKNLKNAF